MAATATATLWVTALVILLSTTTTTLKAKPVWPTLAEINTSTTETSVFGNGNLEITTITFSNASPRPLFIVSPNTPGVYPILLFAHGTMLPNYVYSLLFQQIASHGYVVIAPQLGSFFKPIPSQSEEIEMVASVTNWLPENLQNVLPKDVKGDLSKLAVSGHSKGGKTAFALALGLSETKLNMKISALIGVDPVAGTSKRDRTEPHVLTYKPNSFNLSIPTMVFGTGLGNRSVFPIFVPACAPNEVNYVEFFNECRYDTTQFVVKNYGHLDMLDDNLDPLLSFMCNHMCVKGKGKKEAMRRTLGGLIVAFLEYSLLDEPSHYANIINNPSLAPAILSPVKVKPLKGKVRGYAQT